MNDEIVKRLHRYTENCVAYKLDADFADAVQKAADAIEELVGFVQEAERDRDEYRERLDKANNAIEELQKCLDGVEADNDSLCKKVEELTRRCEQFQYMPLPAWIPVAERLPEHGWYLAYGPTIKMEVLHFHSVEEVWSSERYYNIEVTHWMPLPEPPEEE